MIYHWSWVCLFMNEWPKFLASQLPEWNGQVIGDTIIYSKESVSWSQLHVRILLRDFKKISNSIKHFFIMLFSEFIILIDFKEKKTCDSHLKGLWRIYLGDGSHFGFFLAFFPFRLVPVWSYTETIWKIYKMIHETAIYTSNGIWENNCHCCF